MQIMLRTPDTTVQLYEKKPNPSCPSHRLSGKMYPSASDTIPDNVKNVKANCALLACQLWGGFSMLRYKQIRDERPCFIGVEPKIGGFYLEDHPS